MVPNIISSTAVEFASSCEEGNSLFISGGQLIAFFPYGDGLYGLFWTSWGDAKLEEMLLSTSNLLKSFFLQYKPWDYEKSTLSHWSAKMCGAFPCSHGSQTQKEKFTPTYSPGKKSLTLNYKEVGFFSSWKYIKELDILKDNQQ